MRRRCSRLYVRTVRCPHSPVQSRTVVEPPCYWYYFAVPPTRRHSYSILYAVKASTVLYSTYSTTVQSGAVVRDYSLGTVYSVHSTNMYSTVQYSKVQYFTSGTTTLALGQLSWANVHNATYASRLQVAVQGIWKSVSPLFTLQICGSFFAFKRSRYTLKRQPSC